MGIPKLTIGECYYIRTLTDHWVGRVVDIGHFTVTLTDAAWIADSGRLHEFMRRGRADNMEVEPVGTVGGLQYTAWLPWPFPLFKEAI